MVHVAGNSKDDIIDDDRSNEDSGNEDSSNMTESSNDNHLSSAQTTACISQ